MGASGGREGGPLGEARKTLGERLRDAWAVEFTSLRWRVLLFQAGALLLPEGRAARLRARWLGVTGVHVGAGSRMHGVPRIQSAPSGPLHARLRIGAKCEVGRNVIFEFGAPLTIGDRVTLSDGVVVLTTTHQLGPPEHRAGAPVRTPVRIEDDAHVGEGAIILPGVTIGAGARVLPGSVVNASVADGATVGGIPARRMRQD